MRRKQKTPGIMPGVFCLRLIESLERDGRLIPGPAYPCRAALTPRGRG
jgi:hypothetical protein